MSFEPRGSLSTYRSFVLDQFDALLPMKHDITGGGGGGGDGGGGLNMLSDKDVLLKKYRFLRRSLKKGFGSVLLVLFVDNSHDYSDPSQSRTSSRMSRVSMSHPQVRM